MIFIIILLLIFHMKLLRKTQNVKKKTKLLQKVVGKQYKGPYIATIICNT
uniref:Uncharacterized protein n=1 Tax=Ciona intestinalis TaxID=7719 RepID=H2XRJ4_CIOIN